MTTSNLLRHPLQSANSLTAAAFLISCGLFGCPGKLAAQAFANQSFPMQAALVASTDSAFRSVPEFVPSAPLGAEATAPVDVSPLEDSALPDAPDALLLTASAQSQQPAAPDASARPEDKSEGKQEDGQKKEKRKPECNVLPCPRPFINWYMRFENGPQVKPLTPLEKGWLATKNLIDPFNLITIVGVAGISVAADSHSAYGPGFPGFGRYVGVTFTEDMTGEFFNTFLIPSIVHQDPHYHRMPKASYTRRIFHAISQVAWTQGDNGKGMLNYGNLVGFAIDDEIGNLYVPGRETNASATAQRYAIGLATAPIDNFISEFLPDVAKRIHVQVVVVQRIINNVANKDSGGAF